MAILLRLIPLAILIAIIVFAVTVKKGFRAAIKYAAGISAVFISIMVLIAFISHSNSGHEGDWPYILIILAALISITGSAAGLLLGYLYEKRFNKRS
jgi:heme/copper-type cytochrome/quinol oxidase subunit 4